jgi:chaperone modulatory protein CbpM
VSIEHCEGSWLHEYFEFSLEEMCELSGLAEREIRELVDYDVLAPSNPERQRWRFSADWLLVARSASRLRDDFELDAHALALALTLLKRIRDLEAEVCDLRAKLPSVPR